MTDQQYDYLRDVVWKERICAKMTAPYYGAIAQRLELYNKICNFIGLSAGSIAAYLVLQGGSAVLVAFLALASGLASVTNVVAAWHRDASRFLFAQARARFLENKWDQLWNDIETKMRGDAEWVTQRIEHLKGEDADVQQMVQPHNQKKRLARKIQKVVERSLLVENGRSQHGENDQEASHPKAEA